MRSIWPTKSEEQLRKMASMLMCLDAYGHTDVGTSSAVFNVELKPRDTFFSDWELMAHNRHLGP